jgi:hypothetical protein
MFIVMLLALCAFIWRVVKPSAVQKTDSILANKKEGPAWAFRCTLSADQPTAFRRRLRAIASFLA